jgi:manganese efflux pump family protein
VSWVLVCATAIGLSMDAMAVSVANGCLVPDLRLRQALRMAFFFGLFQSIMPVVGWAAGVTFRSLIQDFDHWVAFGLLAAIGGKMIWESRPAADENAPQRNCLHMPTLLLLSVATSIDAVAVGLGFACLGTKIWGPALVIGVITFVNCLIGTHLGCRLGRHFEKRLGLIGGVILILIGVKIVIEHTLQAI